jgi:Ca2+-binding EF-hand superfamily protein
LEGETGTTLNVPATASDQDIVVVTASDGESTAMHTWTVARMLSGDFDGSGAVDFTDFLTFAGVFGQTVESGVDPIIDIDGSGVVDFADFLIFASFFGVTI